MATLEVKDGLSVDCEAEEETPRLIHKIHIKIGNATSLHGLKGSSITSFVKLEFGATVIGESPKCENDATKGLTTYDFDCNMNVNVNDPVILDDLVQSPIVLSAIEVLPKDRRAREEKTNIIGQACIDMMPLLKGAKTISLNLMLHPPITPTDATLNEDQTFPEIEVNLSVKEALFSNDQLKTTNMMRFGVDNLYSIPEQWNISTANQFMYFVVLPIPISAQKEVTVLIPSGALKAQGEKEQMNNRKWCTAPTASGACLYMLDRPIVKDHRDLDEGDFHSKSDLLFREESENDKAHVAWNVERRCFLSRAASEHFMRKIAQHRIWPLEVFRVLSNPAAKSKGKGEEESAISFHGVAYVDMAPLLYPGVKKIHGAYLIKPFNENDFTTKTGRIGTSIDETVRAISLARSNNSSALPSRNIGAKLGKLDGKPKPSAGVLKPLEQTADQENHDNKRTEGQLYVDARSYIVVDFELDFSLVPRREPTVLAQKVSELIPPRPLFSKKEGGAKKAIKGFQNQIGITANMILDDFQKMFSSEIDSESEDGTERRKREFLYHLNASGKYFAMKEQLKYCVIKIVREKYLKTTQFTNNNELQEFISQLYEFLIAQMHDGLKNFLTKEETVEIPPPVRDSDVMRFFAKEAESIFDYTLAAKYYQERIASNKNDTEHWLDYGCFCLYIDDIEKATECFREVVSINQKHFAGLVMNGAMALMKDDFTSAEVYFESAAYAHPTNEIAWTTLGVFYASIQNDIMAERAFNEAKRLCDPASALKKSYIDIDSAITQEKGPTANTFSQNDDSQLQQNAAGKEPNKTSETESKSAASSSIYLRTTKLLLGYRAFILAEKALSHELVTSGQSANYFQLLAEYYLLQKEYDKSKECIEKCLKDQHQNPDAWTLLGHLHFLTGDKTEARKSYERTLSYCNDAQDVHTLYLRLASIYLDVNEFAKAKDIYLTACTRKPSCMTWLGAGISLYRLGVFSEAEQALQEANILDNHNAMVWSYLTLVCLQLKRHLEAEQCFKFAMKTGLVDDKLTDEIKTTMLKTGFDVSLLSL